MPVAEIDFLRFLRLMHVRFARDVLTRGGLCGTMIVGYTVQNPSELGYHTYISQPQS